MIIPSVFIHPPGTARCEAGAESRTSARMGESRKAAGVPGRLVHDFLRTVVRVNLNAPL